MKTIKLIWIAPFLMLFGAAPALAEMYKSTDANGQITYTNVPKKGAERVTLPGLTVVDLPSSNAGGSAKRANSAQAAYAQATAQQAARNQDAARAWLTREISSEETRLLTAQRALEDALKEAGISYTTSTDAGVTLKQDPGRSGNLHDERIRILQSTVDRHRGNIATLRGELAQLQ